MLNDNCVNFSGLIEMGVALMRKIVKDFRIHNAVCVSYRFMVIDHSAFMLASILIENSNLVQQAFENPID